jgi:hypothetical protein
MSSREAHAKLRAYFKANPSDTSGEWWLAADAMSFREAIVDQLAGGGLPLTDADRAFLGRWLRALDGSTWKRIADKLDCHFWIVGAALGSKRAAEADAAAGENHELPLVRQHHNVEELEAMAASSEALLRYYSTLETSDESLVRAVTQIVEDRRRALAPWRFLEEVLPNYVVPAFHFSSKEEDRERCLFMQRLSIEMVDLFDTPNDLVVAAITALMYNDPSVSVRAVEKQRSYVIENTTPKKS